MLPACWVNRVEDLGFVAAAPLRGLSFKAKSENFAQHLVEVTLREEAEHNQLEMSRVLEASPFRLVGLSDRQILSVLSLIRLADRFEIRLRSRLLKDALGIALKDAIALDAHQLLPK